MKDITRLIIAAGLFADCFGFLFSHGGGGGDFYIRRPVEKSKIIWGVGSTELSEQILCECDSYEIDVYVMHSSSFSILQIYVLYKIKLNSTHNGRLSHNAGIKYIKNLQ